MSEAKIGDTVKIHYTGTLEDGTVFDSSLSKEPLQFTIGEHNIIPKLEEAVVGMQPGEVRSTRVDCEDAYGPHQRELIAIIDREKIPEDLALEEGQRLGVRQTDGEILQVLVTDLDESQVTLDANHPLAGKDLIFELELVEIG